GRKHVHNALAAGNFQYHLSRFTSIEIHRCSSDENIPKELAKLVESRTVASIHSLAIRDHEIQGVASRTRTDPHSRPRKILLISGTGIEVSAPNYGAAHKERRRYLQCVGYIAYTERCGDIP